MTLAAVSALAARRGLKEEEAAPLLAPRQPIGRLIRPSEVAAAVHACVENAAITGQGILEQALGNLLRAQAAASGTHGHWWNRKPSLSLGHSRRPCANSDLCRPATHGGNTGCRTAGRQCIAGLTVAGSCRGLGCLPGRELRTRARLLHQPGPGPSIAVWFSVP
jgi:hypothetical protein